MRNFGCQLHKLANGNFGEVIAEQGAPNPWGFSYVFLKVLEGEDDCSIFLSPEDAAELGRYLIQLAESPDAE